MQTSINKEQALEVFNSKLSEKCLAIYDGFVDPSCEYAMNEHGVFSILGDGEITVDRLLDVCDVELDWYIPSNFAIEFF